MDHLNNITQYQQLFVNFLESKTTFIDQITMPNLVNTVFSGE